MGSDQSGAGTARTLDAAAMYGGDKAIFGFSGTGVTNLVNNSGVVASDTSAVGSAKGEVTIIPLIFTFLDSIIFFKLDLVK